MSIDLTEQMKMLPEPPPGSRDRFEIELKDLKQGQASVVDYFRRGEAIMQRLQGPDGVADKDEETKLVSAFLEGLNDDYIRQYFENYVQEHGLTWRNVQRCHGHMKTVAEQQKNRTDLAGDDEAMSDHDRQLSTGQAAAKETMPTHQLPGGCAAKGQVLTTKKRQLAPVEPGNRQTAPQKKLQRIRKQADHSVELRRSQRVVRKREKAGK